MSTNSRLRSGMHPLMSKKNEVRNSGPHFSSKILFPHIIDKYIALIVDLKGVNKIMKKQNHIYYNTNPEKMFTFMKFPKILLSNPDLKPISCEAKLLYTSMLDRQNLSKKNGWLDENGRIYITFRITEVMELIRCGRKKAVSLIQNLVEHKLIEKKRIGLGHPNRIYVNDITSEEGESIANNTPDKAEEKNSCSLSDQEDPQAKIAAVWPRSAGKKTTVVSDVLRETSRSFHMTLPEVSKGNSTFLTEKNKNNKNNNNIINHARARVREEDYSEIPKSDTQNPAVEVDHVRELESYRDQIRENIEYPAYNESDMEIVDELVEVMADTMLTDDRQELPIGGVKRPASVVKRRLLGLNHRHISYVLFCMHENMSKVKNIYSYLLTTLYHSAMTMKSYFLERVNHDALSWGPDQGMRPFASLQERKHHTGGGNRMRGRIDSRNLILLE